MKSVIENVRSKDLLEDMNIWIKEHPVISFQIARDMNKYSKTLNKFNIWKNNEEFFDLFYKNNILGAIKATFCGKYNFTDKYVKIDTNGNIESISNFDIESEINYWSSNIVNTLLNNYNEYKEYVDIPEEFVVLIENYLATEPNLSKIGG